MVETHVPEVTVTHEGAMLRITLNRPRQLNALTLEMCQQVTEAIRSIDTTVTRAVLLDSSSEKGFCGGGDVKALAANAELPKEFLKREYTMDFTVHTAPVPVVSLLGGITMGGGIGVGGHASHRVVSERSMLAMPEVRIGLMPDVGGHLLLARAPHRLGELLALTARSMNAGDAVMLGFADAYVPLQAQEELAGRLAQGDDPDEAIRALQAAPMPGEITPLGPWWEELLTRAQARADSNCAVSLLQSILAELDVDTHESARGVRNDITAMCPTSCAVSLHQILRTRKEGLDLAAVLDDDYRITVPMAARPDFREGVRAQLVDKDRNPRFEPPAIGELDPAEVAHIVNTGRS